MLLHQGGPFPRPNLGLLPSASAGCTATQGAPNSSPLLPQSLGGSAAEELAGPLAQHRFRGEDVPATAPPFPEALQAGTSARAPRKKKENVPPTTEETVASMARELKSLGKDLADMKALLTTEVGRLGTVGEQANANGERGALLLQVFKDGASSLYAGQRRSTTPSGPPRDVPVPELTPEAKVRQTQACFKPLKVHVRCVRPLFGPLRYLRESALVRLLNSFGYDT